MPIKYDSGKINYWLSNSASIDTNVIGLDAATCMYISTLETYNSHVFLQTPKKHLFHNNTMGATLSRINKKSTQEQVYCGKIEAAPFQKYDFVLANINRNVILKTMEDISKRLIKGGSLLTSGFLNADIELIVAAANKHGLSLNFTMQKEKWRCLLFS